MAHLSGFTHGLKKDPERRRSHRPTEVRVEARPVLDGDWRARNDEWLEIAIERRKDGRYVSVSLTEEDIGKILPDLFRYADDETEHRLVADYLSKRGDAELLAILARVLEARAAPREASS